MTAIIITAIIAFGVGLVLGAWWCGRERDQEIQDIDGAWGKMRDKEIAGRMMRGE